jgi:trehalose 6-phosphate synthase
MPLLQNPRERTIWTADRLRAVIEAGWRGESVVVVSNREPLRHDRSEDGRIVVTRSASGLVTALEPVVKASGGVWVAHGAGTADNAVVDARDGFTVPPRGSGYRLRRVWLDAHEEQGYYCGFSNEGLWPLCHRAHVQPIFRSTDFTAYRAVNARFAQALCDEAHTDAPLILVQDYHLSLVPQLVRRRFPRSSIVTFWHIPWPSARTFEICPPGRQLLEGLLGSSILGFQTPGDCRNFLDTVEASLPADVDRREMSVTHAGTRTLVRFYPVSIEWPSRPAVEAPDVATCRQSVRRELDLDARVRLAVGVDRLDYTKGINEKFLAIERLLETHPELRGRFAYVQIAEPSRSCLPAYGDARTKLLDTCNRINHRFAAGSYRPLVLREAHHEPSEVFRFLRAADVCYVGSLHDAMNLVAKEFVAARDDERGVLVLSRFAGAAQQLAGALIVNPYAIDASAETMAAALTMTGDEQKARMRAMRSIVAEFNAYWWAAQMLQDAAAAREMWRPPFQVRSREPQQISA